MHEYITSMIVLAAASVGIFFVIFLLKKTIPSRFIGNKYIKIIDQLSLGSKERIYLLKINQDIILVGVMPHGMSTFHVCSGIEEQQTLLSESTIREFYK